jgi:hypothetical protein
MILVRQAFCFRLIFAPCIAGLALPLAAQGRGPAVVAASPVNPLVDSLRSRLRVVNNRIELVKILEVRAAPSGASPRSVLVAHGIRADRRFSGDFSDELFGVFVVDDSLTRIIRVLEVLPTPRWLDYEMRIERVSMDSVWIAGKGATYSDNPRRWVYGWE